MNSDSFVLTARLAPGPAVRLNPWTPHQIMNEILSAGYQTLILTGALIDRFSDGVFLFVEDDIKLLIEAYIELEVLIATQHSYQHGGCFNDGLLCFTAIYDETKVDLEFKYCPGLDVGNLVTHRLCVSGDEYAWWWRSIVAGVLTLVESVHKP